MALDTPTPQSPDSRPFGNLSINWITKIVALAVIAYFGYFGYKGSVQDEKVDTWNGVMYCYNNTRDDLNDEINRYLDTVDFKNPEETTYKGFVHESSWQTCENNLDQAITKGNQKPELNNVLTEFKESSKRVVQTLGEITPYYQNKEYLSDQFTKGKTKDTELETLIKKYDDATAKLISAVDQVEDVQRQEDIAAVRNDPKRKNEAYVLQILDSAKKSLRSIKSKTATIADITTKNTLLQSQLNEFQDKVLTDLKAGPNKNKYQAWKGWSDSVNIYLGKAKALQNLGEDIDQEVYQSALDKVKTTYDAMIDQYNNHANLGENYPISSATE